MTDAGEDPQGLMGTLLESLQDGVVVIGPDRCVKAYNTAYIRLFALRPGEIRIGQPLDQLLRLLWERGSLAGHLDREEAVRQRLEIWGTPADRRERRYLTNGRVIDMIRSRTAGHDIVAVNVDVTEALARERALELQRIYTDSILRHIAEAVALVDSGGSFIAFNDTLLDIFRIDREKAAWGMPVDRLLALCGDIAGLPEADRQAASETRRRFFLDTEVRQTERLPGSDRVLDYAKALLPTGGAVLTIRDISDEIARAQEIDDARLRAEESSRHKSAFLARMSHEMRTPMNGVLGTAALLRRTELTGHQRMLVDVIANSGDMMMRLIDDVLDLARLESEGVSLRDEPFSLCTLIRDCTGLIEPEAARKGLWLRKDPSPDPVPPLVGDPVRIKQILLNLLGNAVKFTGSGGVTIGLRVTPSEERCRCTIRIADTGIGIPEAERAAIFRQFYQIDSSMTRTSGGAGLGLTISERLLTAMGGRIGLTSTPGRGTTFEVVLDLPLAGTAALGHSRAAG